MNSEIEALKAQIAATQQKLEKVQAERAKHQAELAKAKKREADLEDFIDRVSAASAEVRKNTAALREERLRIERRWKKK